MSTTTLPVGVELEFETAYYTDWWCGVCRTMQSRHTPVRLIVRRTGTAFRCLSHDQDHDQDEDADTCHCHCHDGLYCTECGE